LKKAEDTAMNRVSVFAVGVALAITAAVANSLCAAAIALWPDQSLAVANTWAHGLDLRAIEATAPMTLGGFLSGLLVLTLIGFAVGVLFAWTYNSIVRRSAG
jgi:hypothetical protein